MRRTLVILSAVALTLASMPAAAQKSKSSSSGKQAAPRQVQRAKPAKPVKARPAPAPKRSAKPARAGSRQPARAAPSRSNVRRPSAVHRPSSKAPRTQSRPKATQTRPHVRGGSRAGARPGARTQTRPQARQPVRTRTDARPRPGPGTQPTRIQRTTRPTTRPDGVRRSTPAIRGRPAPSNRDAAPTTRPTTITRSNVTPITTRRSGTRAAADVDVVAPRTTPIRALEGREINDRMIARRQRLGKPTDPPRSDAGGGPSNGGAVTPGGSGPAGKAIGRSERIPGGPVDDDKAGHGGGKGGHDGHHKKKGGHKGHKKEHHHDHHHKHYHRHHHYYHGYYHHHRHYGLGLWISFRSKRYYYCPIYRPHTYVYVSRRYPEHYYFGLGYAGSRADSAIDALEEGWTNLERGRYVSARHDFARASELSPNWGLPKIGYAMALSAVNNDRAAQVLMRRALADDPYAILEVPWSSRLESLIVELEARYERFARRGVAPRDTWFLTAAYRLLLDDPDGAADAAFQAEAAGDFSDSISNLLDVVSGYEGYGSYD